MVEDLEWSVDVYWIYSVESMSKGTLSHWWYAVAERKRSGSITVLQLMGPIPNFPCPLRNSTPQTSSALTKMADPHTSHDDVIKWKHFPRYWPFVQEFTGHRWIPRTKVSDMELWCFLSMICAWTNGRVNNQDASDLRRHRAHCYVIVMQPLICEHALSSAAGMSESADLRSATVLRTCERTLKKQLVLWINFFFLCNIWTCECSTDPFKYIYGLENLHSASQLAEI